MLKSYVNYVLKPVKPVLKSAASIKTHIAQNALMPARSVLKNVLRCNYHKLLTYPAYTLPMLVIADARVDGNGKFRLQLSREDVPITRHLRFNLMINSDKEYMVRFRYTITKYFSLSTHYDSDMGLGAGLTIIY
jgi:hypothetical protein